VHVVVQRPAAHEPQLPNLASYCCGQVACKQKQLCAQTCAAADAIIASAGALYQRDKALLPAAA
jgi:hypothetical protein